jgi:dCTP deaminase
MILTKKEIRKLLKEKKLAGFQSNAVGPASIDLTLGNKIRVFTNDITVDITKDLDYTKYTKVVNIKGGYILKPGELVLGLTTEKVKLPSNICGWLQSRSRFARIGLMSHITAPFIAPGVHNHQVLEIFNAAQHEIKIMGGVKICQLILEECKGNATYKGKFKTQKL